MMPSKLIATVAGIATLTFGATAPIVTVQLDCPTAYKISVYDTPDGTLADGFYETLADGTFGYYAPSATSSKSSDREPVVSKTVPDGMTEAKVIGAAAKAICTDLAGSSVVKDISVADYDALALPGAGQAVVTESTSVVDVIL
jgi:hypothetical protein